MANLFRSEIHPTLAQMSKRTEPSKAASSGVQKQTKAHLVPDTASGAQRRCDRPALELDIAEELSAIV
eukprot:15454000-Alexandrium_andersonii.AAC.1